VRWLGAGAALALKRGEHSELLPTDLVRAVQEGTIESSVRDRLRGAARLGAVRRDALPGSRSAPSIPTTPPTPEDIVKDIREIETAGSTDLDVLLDEFENQKQILASADQRLALIERGVQPIDDVVSMLENIDRRLTELPPTPSGARLAAAIVLVLMLGVAAGLALQLSQPWESLLAQVFSTGVK
jgi:BMFP domain-containing protein YqiC